MRQFGVNAQTAGLMKCILHACPADFIIRATLFGICIEMPNPEPKYNDWCFEHHRDEIIKTCLHFYETCMFV